MTQRKDMASKYLGLHIAGQNKSPATNSLTTADALTFSTSCHLVPIFLDVKLYCFIYLFGLKKHRQGLQIAQKRQGRQGLPGAEKKKRKRVGV